MILDTRHETIDLRTAGGVCPVHLFRPTDGEPRPAIIMLMDAFGIRPAMFELAEHLSAAGYVVALPDLYYRAGWTAKDAENLFTIPEKREHWTKHVVPTLAPANVIGDLRLIGDYLHEQAFVSSGAMGITGYCMGGRLAFTAAGMLPATFAAIAAYHPGGLATDSPESPHLLAPNITARVYVAGAIDDRSFDDAQKQRLEDALTAAGVAHSIETYPARHGFTMRDQPVYDEDATARHWRTMFELFGATLPAAS